MIHPDLVKVALEKVEGTPFERFANSFYSSLIGAEFVPLGGIKDGGADARDGTIFQDGSLSERYYQASVEKDHRAKIRRTVKRLLEFGREPTSLTFLTPHTVRYSDREELDLSRELKVTIVIRDGSYILHHINDDTATRAAFVNHLEQYTEYLRHVGASRRIPASIHVKSPAVYVFLAQEVERRHGDEGLLDAVTDALALWGLEGTDPDKGVFMTPEAVLGKISETIPGVKDLVGPRIRQRLELMGGKNYPAGRAVRWHRQEGTFCLPWETRQNIEEENAADEALRLRVASSLEQRAHSGEGEEPCADCGSAALVALRALQNVFEKEGLEFARFLSENSGSQYPTISDSIRFALDEQRVKPEIRESVADGAFRALRGVFYDSIEDERLYLQKLSKTYALLFTLNTEPRLVRFFQDMTSDFRLYVGSDQLLVAMSEKFLPEADRAVSNMLHVAAEIGAKLILTEPALEEVVSHLRACDFEHQNHISGLEDVMDYALIREVPHLVLRSYLYANKNRELGDRRPRSWRSYLNSFCEPTTLHYLAGAEDIRKYLQLTYNLEYESAEDLESLVDLAAVEDLAIKLADHKKSDRLAYNDALIALAVYGRRRKRNESSGLTEFGWSTWWLTSETRILQYTRDVVREKGGRYMMRPDFLLNFVALAPNAQSVRDSMAGLFPSLLGVQLGRRMRPDDFHKLMDRVAAAEQLDPARRAVEIAKLSNKLKSDFARTYVSRAGVEGGS